MKRNGGFSLPELVVVLAIFALVALIGLQVIRATVRSSDRLAEISESSGELAVGLALLRQDLAAALPRVFHPSTGGLEPALLVATPESFSLSVGGLARLNPGVSGLGRVTWRLDRATGQLFRQVFTTLTPGAAPREVPVMTGISEFALASYTVQGGWRAGFSADPRAPEVLPIGLKLRLTHSRAGALETVVSLR